MPQKTSIEWTRGDDGSPGYSSNPLRARDLATNKVGWHCVKVSPGCAHCYSEAINKRLGTQRPYQRREGDQVQVFLNLDELAGLLRLNKNGPARVFPCDMTDLFLEDVRPEVIATTLAVFAACDSLTFQVLTKRAGRMAELLGDPGFRELIGTELDGTVRWLIDSRNIRGDWGLISPTAHGLKSSNPELVNQVWPLRNLWAGTSVEDRARLPRIDHLRRVPAAVRFLSLEPLLEDMGPLDLTGIGWVIVGGESGPGARPCDIGWIRSIVDQCQAAETPCFVKQMGANPAGLLDAPDPAHAVVIDRGRRHVLARCAACGVVAGATQIGNVAGWSWAQADADRAVAEHPRGLHLRDKKGGDPSEWPEDIRVREMPRAPLEVIA